MPWVALVGPEEEENLSLRYLASSLAAEGFESRIVPFNSPVQIRQVLGAILGPGGGRPASLDPPVLVGLSLAFQWRAKDFLSLAMVLKEQGYTGHITAGGHFGTFACRELLADFPELDSVCRHEAEHTLVALAQAVVSSQPLNGIPGLAFRDPAGHVVMSGLPVPPELDTLPWPDRRGRPTTCIGHPMAPLVGSRGCYANCAFCCIAAWHELILPGRRFRMREAIDVAREMAALKRQRNVDTFVFHDDNFFLPGHRRSMDRIAALADALDAERIGPIAIVVKARPNDITPEICRTMRERLGLVRLFLGIENASSQGLRTLRRGVQCDQNHQAMRILADQGIYVCFNMLIFEPDTTPEGLETNVEFMERYVEHPLNFGRVELYAGTPLLERMQAEKRCTGDYLGWDYRLATPEMDRIFELAIECFYPRNFAAGALANRLQGTRFDVEMCRHFHPQIYRPAWLNEAKALSRRLTGESAAGLREIIAFVHSHGPAADARAFTADLSRRLRQTEQQINDLAGELESRVQQAVGCPCIHSQPSENTVSSPQSSQV